MKKHYSENRPLDLKDISKIELVGYGGEVSVIAGEEPSSLVAFSEGEIEYRILKDGNVLRIFARPPLLFPKETSIRFQIHIPSGLDLKILGESVPVRVKGRFSLVEIIGEEGDIVLEDAFGKFTILSSKGDIVLRNVSGTVKASTRDGDILAKELIGYHTLRTSTGTLTLNGGEGSFRLFSKYSLVAQDLLFEKESRNKIVCESLIRISGLSSEDGCIINFRAPGGKIKNRLPGFSVLQTGKNFIATYAGESPSRIFLQSEEEILLESEYGTENTKTECSVGE